MRLYAVLKSVFGVWKYVIYPGGSRLTSIKPYCLRVHVAVTFSALLASGNYIPIIRCLQHNTHKHRNLNLCLYLYVQYSGRSKFYCSQKICRTLWCYGFGVFRERKCALLPAELWPRSLLGGSLSFMAKCCLSFPERQEATWRQSREGYKQSHSVRQCLFLEAQLFTKRF